MSGFGSRPSVTPARQAGGTIGIAASGAIASTPDQLEPSLIGLHTTVLTTAGLFTPAAWPPPGGSQARSHKTDLTRRQPTSDAITITHAAPVSDRLPKPHRQLTLRIMRR